jgi:hypothetical protein
MEFCILGIINDACGLSVVVFEYMLLTMIILYILKIYTKCIVHLLVVVI